jgi:hypothetical protein
VGNIVNGENLNFWEAPGFLFMRISILGNLFDYFAIAIWSRDTPLSR